jgi:hypothetical protein
MLMMMLLLQEKLVRAMLSHGMFNPAATPHYGGPMPAGFPHLPPPTVSFDGVVSLPPPPPSRHSSIPSCIAPFPHHPGVAGVVHAAPPASLPPPSMIPIFGPMFPSGTSPTSSAAFPVMHLTPPPSRGGTLTATGCSNGDDVAGRLPAMTSSSGEQFPVRINGLSPVTSKTLYLHIA